MDYKGKDTHSNKELEQIIEHQQHIIKSHQNIINIKRFGGLHSVKKTLTKLLIAYYVREDSLSFEQRDTAATHYTILTDLIDSIITDKEL